MLTQSGILNDMAIRIQQKLQCLLVLICKEKVINQLEF